MSLTKEAKQRAEEWAGQAAPAERAATAERYADVMERKRKLEHEAELLKYTIDCIFEQPGVEGIWSEKLGTLVQRERTARYEYDLQKLYETWPEEFYRWLGAGALSVHNGTVEAMAKRGQTGIKLDDVRHEVPSMRLEWEQPGPLYAPDDTQAQREREARVAAARERAEQRASS